MDSRFEPLYQPFVACSGLIEFPFLLLKYVEDRTEIGRPRAVLRVDGKNAVSYVFFVGYQAINEISWKFVDEG